MKKLHWGDSEDIGIELYEKFPDTDPLTVRFTELHRMTGHLPQNNPSSGLQAIKSGLGWNSRE